MGRYKQDKYNPRSLILDYTRLFRHADSALRAFITYELPKILDISSYLYLEDLIQDITVHYYYVKNKFYQNYTGETHYKRYVLKSLTRYVLDKVKDHKDVYLNEVSLDKYMDEHDEAKLTSRKEVQDMNIKQMEQQELYRDEQLGTMYCLLTPSEVLLLKYLVAGCTYEDIQEREHLTTENVRKIKSLILQKLEKCKLQ